MKKVAFVYLKQEKGEYLLSDEINYNVQRRPQLGFMYMCSVLKDKAETVILDQSVDNFSFDELITILKEYDIAGFYVADVLEVKVKDYIKKIKDRLDIKIIVGGPSTFTDSSYLDLGCDVVCYGEGERTILDLIEHFNGNKELEDISGIYYKKKNKIIKNLPSDLIKNLDDIPFPDRDKIKIGEYHDFFIPTMRKPYTTVIASRGCPYNCTYCVSHKIWGGRIRIRSVDNVLNEVDELVRKYKIKFISFQDDVFGLSDSWLMEFSKRLIEKNYDLKWMCILHPFSLRNNREEGFKLLKDAGCDLISFGLQSAHPKILENINRHSNEAEELKKTLEVTNRLGLLTAVSFIFGLPGDTKETIEYTIRYALDSRPYLVNFYNLSKLRGSDIAEKYGDKPVCDLTYKEINNYCVTASKQFYTNPRNFLRLNKYILFNSPGWYLRNSKEFLKISKYIGLIKQKS